MLLLLWKLSTPSSIYLCWLQSCSHTSTALQWVKSHEKFLWDSPDPCLSRSEKAPMHSLTWILNIGWWMKLSHPCRKGHSKQLLHAPVQFPLISYFYFICTPNAKEWNRYLLYPSLAEQLLNSYPLPFCRKGRLMRNQEALPALRLQERKMNHLRHREWISALLRK